MALSRLVLHLPKTGGRALAELLGARADIAFYHDTAPWCHDAMAAFHAAHVWCNRSVVVMGHAIMGLHVRLGLIPRYHTLLREPLERDLSHYHFLRDEPRHGDSAAALRLDPVTFLTDHLPTDIQTRHVLGCGGMYAEGPLGPGHLDLAKWTLETLFESVGFHDRYPESVAKLTALFGPPERVRQLPTTGARRLAELSAHDRSKLRDRNLADCELYAWARERFPL